MNDLLKKIKGIFEKSLDPTTQAIVDQNRSVNYYKPDWVETDEDLKEDYKKWKEYIDRAYMHRDVMTAFPTEYEFRNMSDPQLAIKDNVQALTNRGDSSMEFNSSFKTPNRRLLKHELFHAKGDSPTYWEDWNPLTARNFQTMPEWLRGMSRNARPYMVGLEPDNQLARQFVEGGTTKVDPRNAADELGAYMYENDIHKTGKPKWMSDRDYQIMINFINDRMGLWE